MVYSCQVPFRDTNLAIYYSKDHRKERAHSTNQKTNCLFPELSCGVASGLTLSLLGFGHQRNLLIFFSYTIFFPCFSKEISVVLSIILTLGNFMNGGTNRGQADGFQLSVLNKIKDVKTQVGVWKPYT